MGDDATVRIALKSTADVSGVDKLNASLGITSTREKELIALRSQFMSAAEAEVATVNKLRDASLKAAEAREAEAKSLVQVASAQKQVAASNPWGSAGGGAYRPSPQFIQQLNEFEAAQTKVAGSSRNMGFAMMQASRGIQDFQAAGVLGAVNNVEGLVMSLGGPAGLAGILTVVAVGLQVALPHIIKFFDELGNGSKEVDEAKTKLQAMATAILGEWTPATQAAEDAADKFTDALKNQSDAFSTLDKAQKASLDVLKQRQSVDAEIAKTKEENDIAEIKAKNLPKEEEARAIAAVKLEKAKADRQRELEGMQGAQTIASEAVSNASQEAATAEATKKKLAAEKQRALLEATLDQELGGIAAQKDKDGKVIVPATKGAAERSAEADAEVRKLEAMEGVVNPLVLQRARDKAAQERQRMKDLAKERSDNIAANGGDQFRKVETIDTELGQASSTAEAAAKKKRDAEFEKSRLDKLQFEQRRKVENEFTQAQGRAVAGLPDETRKPKFEHDHLSDPFEQRKPRRNLVEEEQRGASGGTRRDLVKEEAALAMKELSDTSGKADAALMAEIKRMNAEKKKMLEQIKNMRS